MGAWHYKAGDPVNRPTVRTAVHRRRLVLAGAILAALIAVYSAYWFFAARNFRDGVMRWTADKRAEGWTAAYDDLSVAGFPLWLRAELSGANIAPPGEPTMWRWQGPTLAAAARPWNWRLVVFDFPGAHRVTVRDGKRSREFQLSVARARAIARLDPGGRFDHLSGDMETIETGAAGWRIKAVHWSLALPIRDRANDAASDKEPPGPRLRFMVSGIEHQEQILLGRPIERLEAEIKLVGAIDKGAVRDALAAWRDAGGLLKLNHLSLKWPPLSLEADGAVALDGDLQPIGAMTARIRGYDDAIDILVQTGVLRAGAALAAKLALTLQARRTPDGGSSVTVPLTLQDRRLSIGPVRLRPLPRIDWR